MRKLLLVVLSILICLPVAADEGMWLFNRPPRQLLQQRYGFTPTDAWLEHLQKSSIRFNSGGSGSFVSPNGLMITNHHVGLDCLQKLSTPQHDYVKTGYHARTNAEEVKCVDLELNVLMSIEDVTARVNSAVPPSMPAADAERARRGVMAAIEKESLDKTGLRSDVVTLFQGGEYHLYRSKKYTDVRLVFAPEVSIAFFGGDPDNFEYPRYDLDICLFRAYENGKPAHVENFLRFSTTGPSEGDLVFVSGHPGGTERLNTVAELELIRDVRLPLTLARLRRREVLLGSWAERSAENERRAHDELFGIKNSRKALLGELAGLQDPAVMQAKKAAEQDLRQRIAADPQMSAAYGDAWQAVESIVKRNRQTFVERSYLTGGAFNSVLFAYAIMTVRYVDEVQKPNAERLREFRESNLDSLRQQLFSEAPVYKDMETLNLADSLSDWMEAMPGDPMIDQVLAGKSPSQRAADLVKGTTLEAAAQRRRLVEGGKAAIEASQDSMIRLARLVDPRARALRTAYEQQIDEPRRQAYAKIANARFKILGGSNTYPDATFTLRLAFGTVKGYGGAGESFPWATAIAGAYQRAAEHDSHPPFDLPESWLAAKPKVNQSTKLDFVNTADIIGGNSGSPVVSRAGEFVGIIFDMNLPSLVFNFAYKEEDARAVAVHSAGIIEALRNVYGASDVLNELEGK